MAKITPIRPQTRPCYQCAYSTGIAWLSCTRLTGMPDCKKARSPGSLCGVNGVLWHQDHRYAHETASGDTPSTPPGGRAA